MTRSVCLFALAGTFAVSFAAHALAAGPPIVRQIDHPVDVTESFIGLDPCLGTPALITTIESGVEHLTFLADGTAHLTESTRGTFTAVHVDADGKPVGDPYATGTVEATANANGSFDENGNAIGKTVFTNTLNGQGTRTDGTTFSFHANGHDMHDQNAIQTLEFSHDHCAAP